MLRISIAFAVLGKWPCWRLKVKRPQFSCPSAWGHIIHFDLFTCNVRGPSDPASKSGTGGGPSDPASIDARKPVLHH